MYYANWRNSGSTEERRCTGGLSAPPADSSAQSNRPAGRRLWPKWVAGVVVAAVLLGVGWTATQPIPQQASLAAAPALNQEGRQETAAVQLLGAARIGPEQSGFVAQTISSKTLVAGPLESAGVKHGASEFMGLEYYTDTLSVGREEQSDGVLVRSFSGSASDYNALKAYVELLCSEYDFELVGSPYYKKIKDTFFEFILRYTGPASLSGEKIQGTFVNYEGNMMIYGTIDGNRLKGAIWYDRKLATHDGGYRYGKSAVQTDLVGDSITAGLYRMSNGSYATSDGRLQAAVGQAVLVQDGKASQCTATYTFSADSNRQEILVTDKNGIPQMKFYFPAGNTMETGQIYAESEFIIESSYAVKDGGCFDRMPEYTWPSMFALAHGGEYVVPVLGMSGDMKRVNVRVMYSDDSVSVFYACAQMDSAPYQIEALIAARPTKAAAAGQQASGGASGWCSACGGSGNCSNCGGSGKVRRLLAGTGEWVQQDCTSCRPAGSGNCPFCGGSGKK